MKNTVLCFLIVDGQVLMIHKKRGMGAGLWNVPGGKILPGEDIVRAVQRECVEETGLKPLDPVEVGTLQFQFPPGEKWNNFCRVYRSQKYEGKWIQESQECSSSWINVEQIPYDKMWEDDKRWVPLLLSGKRFDRVYYFDGNDHIIREDINDRI